ncbi:MAG: Bug family tripartite tricarboxylate transporter substrate binding protein [Burkholderiales bacterium]
MKHPALIRGLSLFAVTLACPLAHAQADFPNKPVRLVIGFPPGGPTDIVGRPLVARLSQVMGQQVVADYRAGANGVVAAEYVSKAPPDGYTLYLATTGVLLSPLLSPKITYDMQRDFAPVTLVAIAPQMLTVHPSLPVKTAKELAALAKAKPGQLSYASSGNAAMSNLGMELFKLAAGANIVHIPYKGASPATTDLIGGHVQAAMLTLSVLQPQVKAGRLRALALAGSKRAATMPDIPTMAEAGYPGVNAENWFGIIAPAATPKEVIAKLHAATLKTMDPETRDRYSEQGVDIRTTTPEQFSTFLKEELTRWSKVIREANIRAE